MADKSLGTVVCIILIVAISIWFIADGWGLGGTDLHLINATSAPADGDYDSLDAPLGTTYQVTTGRTLELSSMALTASTSTDIVVTFGYGDVHVESTSTAPTGAVTLAIFTIPAAAGLERLPLNGEIPSAKYPWVQIAGAAWPSQVLVDGVER